MSGDRPIVVQVITQLELGGAQETVLDMCRLLDRDRYRMVLLAGADGYLDSTAARIDGLDFRIVPDLVRELQPAHDLRAFRLLRAHLRELGSRGAPLIVHTHCSKAGILGRLAARAAGIRRIVHTFHGYGHPAFRQRWKQLLALTAERFVARRTARMVAVSRDNIDKGARLGLFRPDAVDLIRSAFDVGSFRNPGIDRAAARHALGVEGDGPIVGTVACLKPQKDPLTLVHAARRVLEARDDAHFVVAGDGALRPQIEALADRLGLRGSFTLLGWREDIPRFLRALDVFVLTSLWEGLPRAVVQAMAAGVPVVASAVDGIRDVVLDRETGLLVEPGDHLTFAARILELLDDPGAAAPLVTRALDEVVPEFEVEEMIRRLDRLYQELLATG